VDDAARLVRFAVSVEGATGVIGGPQDQELVDAGVDISHGCASGDGRLAPAIPQWVGLCRQDDEGTA